MITYHNIVRNVMNFGNWRETRSGKVLSKFDERFKHDMRTGFPLLTTKKMPFKVGVGELLWFLSGKTDLHSLRHYSDLSKDAWTIWTNDAKRWNPENPDDCGELYGTQMRNYNNQGVDQIQNLIDNIKNDPTSRYHIVVNYNPVAKHYNKQALPACHTMFTCYVEDSFIDIKFTQRSADVFLGLPVNIMSYGVLLCIIGQLTSLTPRFLIGDIGDTHIYDNSYDALIEQMNRKCYNIPTLKLPEFNNLDELLQYTAKDFELVNYKHHDAIKVELKVGA